MNSTSSNTHRSFKVLAFLLALTLAVGLPATTTGGIGLAEGPPPRPSAVAPSIDGDDLPAAADSPEEAVLSSLSESATTLSSESPCGQVFQDGADRLAGLQNDDGGWDWPLDNGDPAISSPPNTIGPIGMGLAHAYLHTGDTDHRDALVNAGVFLLAKTNNFSPSDGYLAAQLDRIFAVTTYVDHVTTNFYGPLAAGTYDRNGAGTLYDTASYVNSIRTARANQGIANLAAWDIGMGLVGATSADADTAAWIAGLKAEIDELDGNAYYDVIGLAGAVYGLAFVGADHDPDAGQHAAASSLSDLAEILSGYQIDGGGFTWNMNYLNPGEYNETIQETAYAVLALDEFDSAAYAAVIQGAADYMVSVQLGTGGWENYVGSSFGENNEVTGEALWGISAGLLGPVVSDVLADPNPVPVNTPVSLVAVVDSTPTGCLRIASAEYSVDGGDWTLMNAADGSFDSDTEDVTADLAILPEVDIYSYSVCVRGTDTLGHTSDPECTELMIVVYDPDGGFVTGGGWIDSPAGAYKLSDHNLPALVWDQGFETDDDGWLDTATEWYGTVTRVPSGSGGIVSSVGSYHAVFEGDSSSAPFTRFDGYRDTWLGSWTAEIDVYLDPAWTSGTGFDYSVAATGSDGAHQRDYIFHVTKDTSTGDLLVAGSNNTNFAPREDLENINHYAVTSAGWYTFQHLFYETSGALAVDLNLLDANGAVLFTETRFTASDTIPDEVGGNRYGWFTFINVGGGVAVDEHQLVTPVQPTGKASFGFVSKYKKGAETPSGNTEFVFNAADLNFHSSSYDWLVVTGSDYAKFKGSGTINGDLAPNGEEYKFKIWAGDGDPDTFRIKIWYEIDEEIEIVVYDNGDYQAIAGGNIVIHTKK